MRMTEPVFQPDNTPHAYGTGLKDMPNYMKLEIPAARNVTETRLVTSQPHKNIHWHNYTTGYFPSFMFLFSHKTSSRDRRGHLHPIAYLGVSRSIKDKSQCNGNFSSARCDTVGRCHKRLSARATARLRIQCYREIIVKTIFLFLGDVFQHSVSFSNGKCSYITRLRSRLV
jgi:hypothetical protein